MTDLSSSSGPTGGAVTDTSLTSPYYLHPSDNPGALITSVLLRGDNYTEWATELRERCSKCTPPTLNQQC